MEKLVPLIKPFAGLRPKQGREGDVIAPPYDVVSRVEAKDMAVNKPWSFLHISRPEIDLPDSVLNTDSEAYTKGLGNLKKMIDEGVLERDEGSFYYAYRLTVDDHSQLGIVATASIEDYQSNRIKKHEHTRIEKENDRVKQIDTLNAQTGPVFLIYKSTDKIENLLKVAVDREADVKVIADDGVRHEIWVVRENAFIEPLTENFNSMKSIYVADGHHRSAAASRVALQRKENNPNHTGEENYNFFLSVIFPHNQVKLLDYNRLVRDLNGKSNEDFLDLLKKNFNVRSIGKRYKPLRKQEFGMYLDKQWFVLNLKIPQKSKDPVADLDVSILADCILEPLLGITDPRIDERIDFVGGIRGMEELEKRVDSGKWSVAFSLFPTSVEALMAVADAGDVMPPKSTWFEPKLADGLISHMLD